jgi:hypothetical protein
MAGSGATHSLAALPEILKGKVFVQMCDLLFGFVQGVGHPLVLLPNKRQSHFVEGFGGFPGEFAHCG